MYILGNRVRANNSCGRALVHNQAVHSSTSDDVKLSFMIGCGICGFCRIASVRHQKLTRRKSRGLATLRGRGSRRWKSRQGGILLVITRRGREVIVDSTLRSRRRKANRWKVGLRNRQSRKWRKRRGLKRTLCIDFVQSVQPVGNRNIRRFLPTFGRRVLEEVLLVAGPEGPRRRRNPDRKR